MKATLDTINGSPVLRLVRGAEGRHAQGRRRTYDLPITAEQAKSIEIHIGDRT